MENKENNVMNEIGKLMKTMVSPIAWGRRNGRCCC